jgi:5S rRNA maturation endonuclease (ribonuclease M5)
VININGRQVPVDIRRELEEFTWHRARWSAEKLVAASPFRYDRSPSFFVNLEGEYSGAWGDSGASDDNWKSGGFVKLLSFLRNETVSETCDYLLMRYDCRQMYDYDKIKINLSDNYVNKRLNPLDKSILTQYLFRHPYLEKRGISYDVAYRKMGCGYCRTSKAVTIPWFLPNGQLANIKFRKTGEKTFWYQRGGMPLRRLVYGIDVIYRNQIREATLVESETDAMFLMSAGLDAIATGGSVLTEEKAEVIKRSPIERLYIATDNDAAGMLLQQQIIKLLSGSVELFIVRFPDKYKDVNDIGDYAEVRRFVSEAERVKTCMPKLIMKRGSVQ